MIPLQVEKREGGKEDWNYEKILASVTKAGVPLDEAKHIVSLVEAWAIKTANGGIIASVQIKDKIIQFLRVVDGIIANAYESYKK